MIRINLAPHRVRKRGVPFAAAVPSLNFGLVFAVLYLAAILGVAGYWRSLSSTETRLQGEVAQATTTVTTLKTRIGQETKIKEMLPELQKRLEAITEITQSQSRSVLLFDAFADTVPRDLWINGFDDRNGSLKIVGTAFSTTAVSEFMTNLRRSGKFKDIDILISKQELQKAPRLVTFEVTCRFEA